MSRGDQLLGQRVEDYYGVWNWVILLVAAIMLATTGRKKKGSPDGDEGVGKGREGERGSQR